MTIQSDYLLTVIQADNPCSLKHVINDLKNQGMMRGFVPNLHALVVAKIIKIEDDGTVILLKAALI
jgi:hypothetical protein